MKLFFQNLLDIFRNCSVNFFLRYFLKALTLSVKSEQMKNVAIPGEPISTTDFIASHNTYTGRKYVRISNLNDSEAVEPKTSEDEENKIFASALGTVVSINKLVLVQPMAQENAEFPSCAELARETQTKSQFPQKVQASSNSYGTNSVNQAQNNFLNKSATANLPSNAQIAQKENSTAITPGNLVIGRVSKITSTSVKLKVGTLRGSIHIDGLRSAESRKNPKNAKAEIHQHSLVLAQVQKVSNLKMQNTATLTANGPGLGLLPPGVLIKVPWARYNDWWMLQGHRKESQFENKNDLEQDQHDIAAPSGFINPKDLKFIPPNILLHQNELVIATSANSCVFISEKWVGALKSYVDECMKGTKIFDWQVIKEKVLQVTEFCC